MALSHTRNRPASNLPKASRTKVARKKATADQALLVQRLKAELRAAKREQRQLAGELENTHRDSNAANEEVRSMNEELRTTNEELHAANEELHVTNEELQSTNEELATSKEELQSLYEELTTLNGRLQNKVHEVTVARNDLANLLVSTDIATVFLDTDLRIKWFTTAASRLLNLLTTDIGRPMRHLASTLVEANLAHDASTVIQTLTPLETEVCARDGRQYFLRVLPYLTEGRAVNGVVLTLMEITALKHTQRELLEARDQLEQRVADRTRWLSLMHEVASEINAAMTWDDALNRVVRRLCQTELWQIGYIYLPRPENPDTLEPAIGCCDDRRFQSFQELSMRQSYARGERLPGWVYASKAPFWAADTDALLEAIPIRAALAASVGLRAGAAFPITSGDDGEVVAVLEIFSDRPHPPGEQLTTLMHNVSDQIGRVLDRERATARLADLVWRERQELSHTLHDSLGQTLTGLGMLSAGLGRHLAADPEGARMAAEITWQTQNALDQVRRLAKKLFPADVDGEGLMAALRDLATMSEALHKIQVQVTGSPPRTCMTARPRRSCTASRRKRS